MSEQTKSTYKINLSNGSCTVLRHLLNQQGWTKTVNEYVTASELLANLVPEPTPLDERPHPMTTPNYKSALDEWKKAEDAWTKGSVSEFVLTEKQRDTVKTCLRYSIEKQTAVPSKPGFDLFIAFGLTE